MIQPLLIDDKELSTCVGCGLCLPFCPTYRVTGEESASPRGRIAAMRMAQGWSSSRGSTAQEDEDESRFFTEFAADMEMCVQCRACERACPSSVPFGSLMEQVRYSLANQSKDQSKKKTPAAKGMPGSLDSIERLGLSLLAHHELLLGASSGIALAQRFHLLPKRIAAGLLPDELPIVREPLESSGNDAWLFTGCIMDAWMRKIHQATLRVMELAGAGVSFPNANGACCGALHLHHGLMDGAMQLARKTMASMPGTAPVVVNSAGCGATMKEYGRLMGTSEAHHFSSRVVDVHEWLEQRMDYLPDPKKHIDELVAVQDPCHLRHVQQSHMSVRAVLERYVDLVELDDDGMCCGAGGAYMVEHPRMAQAIRSLKLGSIQRSGATLVASANPGCIIHLKRPVSRCVIRSR